MAYLLNLEGFLVDGDERMPFKVQISRAEAGDGDDHYVSTISMPTLFSTPRAMRGRSPEEAEATAIRFVDELIGDREVVDENGEPLTPDTNAG
ncbi:hypothetical protein H0Z60_11215 [Ectothiorhodospiraceae bacterium WFHF3C12]|nr:hypothetical protein [Ectothiorhodospiraceae bacterium WFHF3C12]